MAMRGGSFGDFLQQRRQARVAAESDPFEVLTGEEFERDLRRRQGGLITTRKVDRPVIEQKMQEILSGALNDEQVRALIHRNPGAAAEFTSAFQHPARQRVNTLGRFFEPGGLRAVPSEMTVPPDVTPGPNQFQATPLAEGQAGPPTPRQFVEPPQFDADNAIAGLLNAGDLEGATKLADIAVKMQSGRGGGKPQKIQTRDAEGNDIIALVDNEGNIVRSFPGQLKPIPQSGLIKLQEYSDSFDRMYNLTQTFQPRFGGFGSNHVGNAAQAYRKRFGDDTEFVQWWQGYQDFVNDVRKRLFGSALTETEKDEFNKAIIMPGMSPAQIQANLQRQRNAAWRAAQKLSQGFAAGNYDSRQVRAALGENAPLILRGPPKKQNGQQQRTTKPAQTKPPDMTQSQWERLQQLRQKYGR